MGDWYQDLWVAEILMGFLEHPSHYKWVRFEDDEAGYLDDITAQYADGSYMYRLKWQNEEPRKDVQYSILNRKRIQ